jgi:16S rRNA G1207 methylase RsmC
MSRLLIGAGASRSGPDHVVALTHDDRVEAVEHGATVTTFRAALAEARRAVSGDPATATPPPDEVLVTLPTRRGQSFVALLSWLVEALVRRDGPDQDSPPPSVHWSGPIAERGATRRSFATLAELGWVRSGESKSPGWLTVTATPPSPPPSRDLSPPGPARRVEQVGSAQLDLAADWGVFSAAAIDAGSRLLLEALVDGLPVTAVADIGCGYGPLGLGLAASGLTTRVIGTEVDDVALALFDANAARLAPGIDSVALLEPDPTAVDATELTVCNFPTHASRADSDHLLAGLVGRAAGGRVVLVVHRSLEDRFVARLAARRASASVLATEAHVVLEIHASGG